MKRLSICLVATALAGCPGPDVHVPGATKDVKLVVKLAALSEAQVNGIGSFTMKLIHDGGVVRIVPLNFTSSTRSISFLGDAPADFPTAGKIAVTLQAADLTGSPLPIGGRSNTVDLDAADGGGTLFALVGAFDAPTPLDVTLSSAASDVVVAVGSGILALGGGGADWIDLATGFHCANGEPGCLFSDAAVPVGRIAVDVSNCAGHANQALVVAEDGTLSLFDPAGLASSGAFTTVGHAAARNAGSGFLSGDCRVVLVGGASTLEVVTLGATSASVASSGGVDVDDGALVDLGNALGDHALIGGTENAPSANAVVVTPTAAGADLCISGDPGCNGAESTMQCPRATPVAARIDDGSDQTPTLVLGGDCTGAQAAEMLLSAQDAPFTRFIAVDESPALLRPRGAALHAFGKNKAVLVGGIALPDNANTNRVEVFTLDSVDVAGAVAHGGFNDAPSLADARNGPFLVEVGGALVVAGGGSTNLEVLVPEIDE